MQEVREGGKKTGGGDNKITPENKELQRLGELEETIPELNNKYEEGET